MKTPENPPAFPQSVKWHGDYVYEKLSEGGMTLRDYFAAKAMQGRLFAAYNNPDCEKVVNDINVANEAYRIADAMLAAREV